MPGRFKCSVDLVKLKKQPVYLSLAIIKILLLNIFFMYNARLKGMRINGWEKIAGPVWWF